MSSKINEESGLDLDSVTISNYLIARLISLENGLVGVDKTRKVTKKRLIDLIMM